MSDKTNEATKWIPVTSVAQLKDGAHCRDVALKALAEDAQ